MKKHNPEVMMPDKGTEVLAYYECSIGYVVAYFDGEVWREAWGGELIGDAPAYWVDLDDLKKELK